MKKWWVGLLLMAVALVMIPATTLALKYECDIITHYCTYCEADRECRLIIDIIGELADENSHEFKFTCNTCGREGSTGRESHYGGNPTCIEPAECAGCGLSYTLAHTWVAANCQAPRTCSRCGEAPDSSKDPNNHEHTQTTYANATGEQHWVKVVCEDCKQTVRDTYEAHDWGKWTADGMTHSRTCQKPGCGAVDTGRHTSEPGATCVSAQTCAICNLKYLDPGNHEGRRVTTYAIDPVDAYRHIATQTCAGCQAVLSAGSESHTTDKPATCMKGAHCSVCDLYYGSTRSHLMGAWQPADDGQRHYRTCEYGCGETDYAEHGVTRTATCMTLACCGDCGFFGEVDADAHDWTEWKIWDDDQHWRYCRHNVREHVEYADHTGGTATCEARAMCDVCDESYGQKLGHDYVEHEGKEPTCTEGGWYDYVTCSRCDYSGYVEKSALGHDRVSHDAKAPTCTDIGWDAYETCSRCDYTTYSEKSALGHDYAAKTTKPTCTQKGYTTHTCTRCQDSYRDGFVSALGHWYGEWAPNADGTHSATCRRGCGYRKTVPCTLLTCQLQSDAPDTAFTLCPVCGEVSDGTRLVLAEAAAKSVTGQLPAGEVVVRIGALAGGEQLMSVAFERGGELTRPTGQVKITLPAELLDGYALCLLSEDGTETELALDVQEEASFVLDFTDSLCPVQVIRLVPEV